MYMCVCVYLQIYNTLYIYIYRGGADAVRAGLQLGHEVLQGGGLPRRPGAQRSYTYVCIYIYIYICTCIVCMGMCIYIYVFIYCVVIICIYIYIYIYVYIHMSVGVYIHIYVYMYIHTMLQLEYVHVLCSAFNLRRFAHCAERGARLASSGASTS